MILKYHALPSRTDLVLARVEARASDIARLADEGDPSMQQLLANGHLSDMQLTVDHIRGNAGSLEAALSAP
jgi:hypothetical protein